MISARAIGLDRTSAIPMLLRNCRRLAHAPGFYAGEDENGVTRHAHRSRLSTILFALIEIHFADLPRKNSCKALILFDAS